MKSFICIGIILILMGAAHASEERLAVAVPIANIRSGPGTRYDILWKVEQYYPVLILERSGSWCLFRDFEGDKGWISKSLLGKIHSVISKKENCNVRTGPGTQFQVAFIIEKGIPFRVLQHKANWIHVQHADGDKGWIHESLVW
ncbi:MAG: SH3 domain-containing protein [Desulfobacterales bacterium]|nr:SH3 domain-containing protein [Desulfobacterales bacterium]